MPTIRKEPAQHDKRSSESNKKTSAKVDLADLAKMGGDLFKKTLVQGVEVIKDVSDSLPKDAQKFVSDHKADFLKHVPKEVLNGLMLSAIDRTIEAVKEHRLEISIGFKKVDDDKKKPAEKEQPKKGFAGRK